jgi:hypothetical protein
MMFGNPYLPQLQNMQAQLAQLQGNQPQQQAIQQGYQIQTVFAIPPSSSIVLMDTDSSVFYVKTTDANGLETVKAYEFSEKEVDAPELTSDKYVLKSDFEKLSEQVEKLLKADTSSNAEKSTRGGKTA